MAKRSDSWEWIVRLPLVSLGAALAVLVAFPVVHYGFEDEREQIGTEIEAAIDYAIKNPMVQIDSRLLPVIREILPNFESNEIFAFLKRGRDQSQAQQAFDQLFWNGFRRLDAHPYRRLGVVPIAPSVTGFLAHPIVHVGWVHALGAVLLILLAGPLMEQSWGHGLLAACLLVSGAAGAAVFWAAHPGVDRAMVGAGTWATGLVAAVGLRFRDEQVDLVKWLSSGSGLSAPAPAWVLAVAWACYEAALWFSVPGAFPRGLDNAIGYSAHAGAAVGGAMFALAVDRLGLERRFGTGATAAVERRRSPQRERFDLEKVLRARAAGESDAAYAMLRAEARRSARNRDAVTIFWEMAIERGEAEGAAPAMLMLVSEELRRNAPEAAVAHWRELAQHMPEARLDPRVLLRLIPSIQRLDGDEHAVLALQQAMDSGREGPTPAVAAEIARFAADLDGEIARTAAELAMTDPGLDEARRAELRTIVERHRKQEEGAIVPAQELPPNAFYEEQDRSGFGEVGDLTQFGEAGDRFPTDRVTDANPMLLEERGLLLEVLDGPDVGLAYSDVSVVAVAGVKGLGPKPIVLVDVFATGVGDDSLRIFRMRSDRFDPRRVVEGVDAPLDALRELLDQLLQRTQARPLPSPSAARADPVQMFDSLDAYQDFVASRLDV